MNEHSYSPISFHYHALHIPSGSRFLRVIECWGRVELLAQLNEWNAQCPGIWQYWAD